MKIASVYASFAVVALGLGLTAIPAVPAARASPAAHAHLQPSGPGDVHLIGGVVRLADGAFASDVCVTAAGPTGTAHARTVAGGRYELTVPRAGRYLLAYRDCDLAGRSLSAGAAAAPTAVRQVRAVGSATVVPELTLPRPATKRSLRAALAAAGVSTPQVPRLAAAASPQAAAPGTRSPGVAGKVTGPSGRPLAGICATVVGKGRSEGIGTDRNGNYTLSVPPGWYPIEFTSSCNSFPFPDGPWAAEWYRHAFSQAAATKVHIRAGKITRNVNAVMARGGEITGTVTGAHGKPLAGICVVLTTASGVEVDQATTPANGKYRLTGLDPGRYRALFTPGCRGGLDYAQTWWPHAHSLKKAKPITVRLGHVTAGIDARLQKLGTITGRVRLANKSGKPLGGMCVSAYPPGNPAGGGFASTARNGTFVIKGLPAGQYRVLVNPGCNNNGNYLSAFYPRLVRVSDGRTVTVNVYLQPGGIISGTVRSAATGKPVAGICVEDDNGDDGVTNADGSYQVDQLRSEVTTVTFSGGCGNRGSYAPQWYPGLEDAATAANVVVRAGHDTEGINAAMLPGATITGRVTAASGKGLGGVCVFATPSYAQLDFGAGASSTRTGAYSLANLAPGDYEINFSGGCWPSTFNLGQQWYRSQPTETTAGLVNARAGATVSGIDGTVSAGGSISGTITSRSGKSVQVACLTAVNTRTGLTGGALAGLAFGSGSSYELDGLAPGKYIVYATDCLQGATLAPGRYKAVVTVRAHHDTGGVNIVLPPGGTITGRVTVRGSGKPAVGVCVTVSNGNPVTGPSVSSTGSDGRYSVPQLNGGSYRVAIDTSGCEETGQNLAPANRPGRVHVTAGRVTSGVNWSVGTGGTISGQVTGPAGQPEPGICVEAYKSADGPYLVPLTGTGSDGSYQLQGLAAGRYKVLFGDPSCSTGPADLAEQWYEGATSQAAATTVTVTAGHVDGNVDAALGTYGTITGSVASASAPLTGVCVTAVPVTGNLSPVYTTSRAGTYALTSLPPGRYRVEFQSGCGATGWAAQWWQHATSGKKATVLSVLPGSVINGINAEMTAARPAVRRI